MGINLLGVVHGGYTVDFFLRKNCVPMIPSNGFFEALKQFSEGSRVGLEWFEDDFSNVRKHLSSLTRRRTYLSEDASYWNRLVTFCKEMGHELVFLEDEKTWFRYNEALAYYDKVYSELHELSNVKGESYLDSYLKLCSLNERLFCAEMDMNKIHDIDRDDDFLGTIRDSNLDLAIVGLGHSEFWMINQSKINRNLGIVFDAYSRDTLRGGPGSKNNSFELVFESDPVLGKKAAFDRVALEKILFFIENGSFSSREPDYVGIWEWTEPSKGYFEMFIEERAGSSIKGVIEDRLGVSEFGGGLTEDSIIFSKMYSDCTYEACGRELEYRGRKNHYGYHGGFSIGGEGAGAFFISKYNGKKPLDLSRCWFKVIEEEKLGQLSLELAMEDEGFEEGDLPF